MDTKRKGFSIAELMIMMLVATFFIMAVYAGINIIIDALGYSKKVMFKLYARKEIDMTYEILDFEVKRTGSLGPVVMGLPKFYDNNDISTGNEEKGIFAVSQNEFVIQYGVSYPYALVQIGIGDTYEKIIKDKPLPATVNIDGAGYWPTVTSGRFFETPQIFLLPEASITSGVSVDATTVELSGAPPRVFFLYKPFMLPSKLFELNGKDVYGQRLHTIRFLYSKESSEEASSLKMIKYYPFVDEVATSVLLRDLIDYKVEYGSGSSNINHRDFDSISTLEWDSLNVKTVKISFVTSIPDMNATLSSSKILWIP